MLRFYGYKKCSTCRKAERFLTKKKIDYEFIDITQNPPTHEQLKKILQMSGLPVKKLFNTSGQVYREMNLKSKVETMTDQEALGLLFKNGKLIKRPLVLAGDAATVGFREEEFRKIWK